MAKGSGARPSKGGEKRQGTGAKSAGIRPVLKAEAGLTAGREWPATKARMRRVAELVPYAKNARTHSPEQVRQVADSIRRWGWTMPVLIRAETDGIIAGHGRILAAELLGIDEVPTVEAVGWSDEEVRAYIIADNKLALNAGWDNELLAAELKELQELGFDLDVIGFSDAELRELDPERSRYLKGSDEVPEVGALPASAREDVWICGPHRIACGDATVPEDVARAMGGESLADCVWSDPPYGVAVSKWEREGIQNDAGLSPEDFAAFLLAAFVAMYGALKPGSAIYIAHSDTASLELLASFKSAGFHQQSVLIWAKNTFVMGRKDHQQLHEPVLYGWKPGAAHRWYGGRKACTVAALAARGTVFGLNADGTVTVRVGQESLVISGTNLMAKAVEPTVLEIERPRASEDHPTTKPVALIKRHLLNSTREGDVVLDPFGGSGSTLIACEELGRHARLVEVDGRFVDVAVRRWQEFTGREAVREADGASFNAAVAAAKRGGGK